MIKLVLIAACAAGLAGCWGVDAQDPSSGPVPALSRSGARWEVKRGERPVLSIVNEPGKIRWNTGEVDHPFASGKVMDPREEAKLRLIVKQSRHFRDLVRRLQTAGYGVASADAPAGG